MRKNYPKGFFDLLPEKIKQSIYFLQEHEPPEGYFVGFSGGKDSIVLEHLIRLSRVKHELWYSNTTIEPPEMYKFIKANYPGVNIYVPKRSFWELMQSYNPPLFHQRWCCRELKKKASKSSPLTHLVMGMRAEEGTNRSRYQPFSPVKVMSGKYYVLPLLYWNEADIWQYIEENNLSYCQLYNEGFSRLGCVVCPMRSEKEHQVCRAKWPQMYKVFEKAVTKWWNKRLSQGRDMTHSSPEEYIQAWYKRQGDRPYLGRDTRIVSK